MKKAVIVLIGVIVALVCVTALADTAIDESLFPDAVFRDLIKRDYDTDQDGKLSDAEIAAVTSISCIDCGISDLTGIGIFKNLEHLLCWKNNLTELDISQNKKINWLLCNSNQIKALDVSSNPQLCSAVLGNKRMYADGADCFGTFTYTEHGHKYYLPFLRVDCNTTVKAGAQSSEPDQTRRIIEEANLCGDIYYKLDNYGLLTIYGQGDMAEFSGCEPPFFNFNVDTVVIEEGIISLGDHLKQSTVRTVRLPNSMTKIDTWAFKLCTNLKTVTIPDSVQTIGNNAFVGCSALESVHLGSGLTRIDYQPFNACDHLKTVTISPDNKQLYISGDIIYDRIRSKVVTCLPGKNGIVEIPDGINGICCYAFDGVTGLTGVKFPDSLTSIEEYAFGNCTGLTEIVLPDSVRSLGKNAFSGCAGLRSAVLGKGIEQIPFGFFDKCAGLISLTIPEGVKELVAYAFGRCTGLRMICLPQSIEKIDWYTFTECTGLTDVYYAGTREDCAQIEIDESGNEALLNAKWHYEAESMPDPDAMVRAFITRCYSIILGRAPDAGGLQTWFEQLSSGRKTASEIIDRFVNSTEFTGKNYSDGDKVDILYQAMLGRNADEGGKQNWVRKLENGQTLAHVINGFCFSKEFRGLCESYGIKAGFVTIPDDDPTPEGKIKSFIQRCYRIILDREADASGLQTWYNELSSKRKAASEIIDRFVNSPEFLGKNYSNGEAVEILYKAMLGRTPDEAGKAHWVGKLDAGQPFAAVINGFCTSAEFTGICESYGIEPGSVKVNQARLDEPISRTVVDKEENEETASAAREIILTDEQAEDELDTAVMVVYYNRDKVTAFIRRCYNTILERNETEEAINNWVEQILNGAKTPDQIIRGFLFSDEFKNKNTTNEDLVKILYRVYMNREADPEGLATWTGKLDAGMTLKELADTFARTGEYRKMVRGLEE